jgi:hypothetical protein
MGIDRDRNGHFLPGNQASIGNRSNREYRQLQELRQRFLSCVSAQDIREAYDELRSMSLTCKDERVRLAALTEFLDRFMGKPSLNLDIQKQSVELHAHATTSAIIPQLSAEETAVLAKIVEKSPPLALPAPNDA